MSQRTRTARSILFAAVLLTATVTAAQQKPIERIRPAEFGAVFPVATFQNLNPTAGGPEVNLGLTLGRKAQLCLTIKRTA